jgi:hypothetical protein
MPTTTTDNSRDRGMDAGETGNPNNGGSSQTKQTDCDQHGQLLEISYSERAPAQINKS